MIWSSLFWRMSARATGGSSRAIGTYLEALVLQHALDGGILTRRRQFGLENDTEGAIADDLALGVLHLLGLPSKAVLDLLTDDFYCSGQHCTARRARHAWLNIPPILRLEKADGRFCDIVRCAVAGWCWMTAGGGWGAP